MAFIEIIFGKRDHCEVDQFDSKVSNDMANQIGTLFHCIYLLI